MSQAKICYWVTKLPTLSWDAFVEHWTTIHAQLATGLPGLRAYSINLAAGPGTSSYDGYAMLRFDDRDAAKRAWASPSGVATAEDGELFMQRPPGLMVDQRTVKAHDRDQALTKVCHLVRRHPSLDWDEFVERWTSEHAEAVLALPGLAGYALNIASPEQRGGRPFDGYSVQRFETTEQAEATGASPEAREAATIAERLLTSTTLVVTERVVVAPSRAER